MRKFMAAGLVACMLVSGFTSAGYASPVTNTKGNDVQGHWAEANLREWSAAGVLAGYPDGTMQPDHPISRAEFSVMLQRLFGVTGTSRPGFTDVPANAWYAASLAGALQAGYVTGYADGTFKPDNSITRAEAAVMLSRAFQLSEAGSGIKTDVTEAFKDKSAIRAYALTAVKELVLAQAIQGYPDGSFRPQQPVTRGEAVTLLDRLAGILYREAVADEGKELLANAVIGTGDVTLGNKEVKGHLYLTPGIRDGNVTLQNTTVSGVTFLNGKPNTIHIKDSNLAQVIVNQPNHTVRLVLEGKTTINKLVLRSPATIQVSEGASIQELLLQKGSSGSSIDGKGTIRRVTAESTGITVNGQALEIGQAYVWSSDRAALIPSDKSEVPGNPAGQNPGTTYPTPGNSNPGTGNSNGNPPVASWPPVAAQGSIPGTTKITASVTPGNQLAVIVSSRELSSPQAGSTLEKSSLAMDPYESGTDISGVDPTINKYLGVYEIDKNRKIVRFRQVTLSAANIKPEAWNIVWKDEFEGSSIDSSKWNFIQGGGGYGNSELQNYTNRAENARIEDGNLVIEAHKENYQGNAYTSAKLTTEGKGDWTYGKFEIRAKMPQGQGIWPALWMMPSDENLYSGWPTSGEIDIMELLGHEPSKVYGTLHYGSPHGQTQGSYSLSDGATFADDFHTFAVEWEPGEFRYYVDGVLYAKLHDWASKNPQEGGEYTYPAPFDRDFFLQMNLAVGGTWPGNPDSSTVFPQQMLVDYVRVYEREGQAYRQPTLPDDQAGAIKDPGADGNYVENGSFEEGLNNWVFQPFAPPTDLFGGAGSVELDQGAIKTTIDKEGNESYAIQLVQAGLPLLKGSTYQLSFDAWSTGDRTMVASLSGPDRGYTRYMDDQTVALTGDKQTYTSSFTMKSDTDANARLEFNMGKAGTLPVWIDQVQLIKTADPDPNAPRDPLPSGNYIYNGTFDQGKNRLGFWTIEGSGSTNANIRVGSAINDRKLYVKPAFKGSSDALLLRQGQLSLKEGKTYILSFQARAEAESTITARISNQTDSNLVYAKQDFTIGTDTNMQTYTFIFDMDSEGSPAMLEFELGALADVLQLDNVSLKEMSPPVVISGTKRIEAENYSDMKGVQKGDDGLSVGWIDPGDWMQYIVDVKKAGEYKVSYYVASGYEGGGSLTLLGKKGSVYDHTLPAGEILENEADYKYTMPVANTGDWGKFDLVEQTETIQLEAGIQTLQLYAPHVNVDYFILTDVNFRGNTGNLVRNGTFDQDVDGWQTYQSDNLTDKLSISAEKGAMRIHLPEIMLENWNQQVYQDGITLEQGRTYTVTFDVYSEVDRPIQLAVGFVDPANNYAYTDFLNGNKPTFWLTKDKKQQQFSFVMNHPTQTNSKLEFDLGQLTVTGVVYDTPGDIFLDNIRLNSSLIENGLFDENTDKWTEYWGDSGNGTAVGRLLYQDRAMVIEIDKTGSQNWIPQISQEGIRLEKGKTYLFSFDARANADRSINIGFGKKLSADPWYDGYFGNDVSLTTEMKTYTFMFTMNAETEDNARIDFNVGNYDNSVVILDNISLIELD